MHNRFLIYFKVMVYIRKLNSLLEDYPQLTMYFLIYLITEDIDVAPVNFHISDHLGISVNLRTNHFITRKSKVKIVRPLSDEGKFMFFKFLENVNWNFVDLSFDLNVKFQMFMNTIMYYYNLAFPQKQIFCKTGSRSNTSVKWFTPVLDKMRNTLGLICDAQCC
jgi:hypothetical protein